MRDEIIFKEHFMNDRSFYTIDETAKILKVSRITIHRKLRTGEIPAVRVGRRVLVPALYFEQLTQSAFQSNENAPEGAI